MAFCTLRSVHILFSSVGFLIRRVSRGNSPSCFESLFFFSFPRQRLNASLLNKNMEVATSPEKTRGTTKLEYFLEGAWDATSDTKAQSFFHFPPTVECSNLLFLKKLPIRLFFFPFSRSGVAGITPPRVCLFLMILASFLLLKE